MISQHRTHYHHPHHPHHPHSPHGHSPSGRRLSPARHEHSPHKHSPQQPPVRGVDEASAASATDATKAAATPATAQEVGTTTIRAVTEAAAERASYEAKALAAAVEKASAEKTPAPAKAPAPATAPASEKGPAPEDTVDEKVARAAAAAREGELQWEKTPSRDGAPGAAAANDAAGRRRTQSNSPWSLYPQASNECYDRWVLAFSSGTSTASPAGEPLSATRARLQARGWREVDVASSSSDPNVSCGRSTVRDHRGLPLPARPAFARASLRSRA